LGTVPPVVSVKVPFRLVGMTCLRTVFEVESEHFYKWPWLALLDVPPITLSQQNRLDTCELAEVGQSRVEILSVAEAGIFVRPVLQ